MYLNNLFFIQYEFSNEVKIEILESDKIKVEHVADTIGITPIELKAVLNRDIILNETNKIEMFERVFFLKDKFWNSLYPNLNLLDEIEAEFKGNYKVDTFKPTKYKILLKRTHQDLMQILKHDIDLIMLNVENSELFFDFQALELGLFKDEQEELKLLRRCYSVLSLNCKYSESIFETWLNEENEIIKTYNTVKRAIRIYDETNNTQDVKNEELVKHLFKETRDVITPYIKGVGSTRKEEVILFNSKASQKDKKQAKSDNDYLLWHRYIQLLFEENKSKEEAEDILLRHNPEIASKAALIQRLNRIRRDIKKEREVAGLPIDSLINLVSGNPV